MSKKKRVLSEIFPRTKKSDVFNDNNQKRKRNVMSILEISGKCLMLSFDATYLEEYTEH